MNAADLETIERLAREIDSRLHSFEGVALTHRSESAAKNDVLLSETHQKNLAAKEARNREARELANRTGSKAGV